MDYSKKVLDSLDGWGLRLAILEEGLGNSSLPALYLAGCFYGWAGPVLVAQGLVFGCIWIASTHVDCMFIWAAFECHFVMKSR